MGNNDAREQLQVCRDQYDKLENKYTILYDAHRTLLRATGMHPDLINKIMDEYS